MRIPSRPIKTSFNKQELKSLFTETSMQEALFLASPDLLSECTKWLNGEFKGNEDKLIISLLKYAIRSHTRCTPFGTFAGCSLIDIGTKFTISDKAQRKTRLDMGYLCLLAENLSKHEIISKYLKFTANTSIYLANDQYRYVEYFNTKTGKNYRISSTEYNEYLEAIINRSNQGASIEELTELLVNREIEYDEAKSYLKDIIDAQILLSELEPSVIGEDWLDKAINLISDIQTAESNNEIGEFLSKLIKIKDGIASLDGEKPNDLEKYKKISNIIDELGVPYELNKLFQADLFYNISNGELEGQKSQELKKNLLRAINILYQVSPNYSSTAQNSFLKNYRERYGDEETPLLLLLDNESGIGYGKNNNSTGDNNSLFTDLLLINTGVKSESINWSSIQGILLKKIFAAAKSESNVINLDETDIPINFENWDSLPVTQSIVFEQLGNDLVHLKNVGNPSAVNLIGRFGAGNEDIASYISEIVEIETNYNHNVIVAELTHLPEGRAGNVLLRPVHREYEIPYLAKSSNDSEKLIKPQDIMVGVMNGKIYLRSVVHNKQIIVKNSSAHNYMYNSLPIYHFLSELHGFNKKASLYLNWGVLKSQFDFLPRVCIGNVIIALATWTVKRQEILNLLEHSYFTGKAKFDGEEDFSKQFYEWVSTRNLPNSILLSEGETDLHIDLTSELSIKLLLDVVKYKDQFILKEYLYDVHKGMITNKKGQIYSNEVIATLYKSPKKNTSASQNHTPLPEETFYFGSEWLYFKIYCGFNVAEKMLSDNILPISSKFVKEGLIDKWFFIKYTDPDFHIRLRFHLVKKENLIQILDQLNAAIAPLLKQKLIWKFQNDCYIRESNRYGGISISICESIFYMDSISAIGIMETVPAKNHWIFALKSVDSLLNDFGYDDISKFRLIDMLKVSFSAEFEINKPSQVSIDKKYRRYRQQIEDIIENRIEIEYNPVISYLKDRSISNNILIKDLLKLRDRKKLTISIEQILISIIHMTLNRLSKNTPRKQEYLIYDFLSRSYKSKIFKNKSKIPTTENEINR